MFDENEIFANRIYSKCKFSLNISDIDSPFVRRHCSQMKYLYKSKSTGRTKGKNAFAGHFYHTSKLKVERIFNRS